ncbi:hypothetical protein BB559_001307 [Furculomyces boomerangus]|uniref:Dolichyl pyrophosphate Glc1Man9GlcNAc2 alpha-1,3-glucosyltransferase n=1 Tax=Furculomyces boomerangus TaxID=61424 RepID=A0A2T9Z2K1_9FUNG|nr:hypothetical protein BB559_001307 [Furculomyces boomerangus]
MSFRSIYKKHSNYDFNKNSNSEHPSKYFPNSDSENDTTISSKYTKTSLLSTIHPTSFVNTRSKKSHSTPKNIFEDSDSEKSNIEYYDASFDFSYKTSFLGNGLSSIFKKKKHLSNNSNHLQTTHTKNISSSNISPQTNKKHGELGRSKSRKSVSEKNYALSPPSHKDTFPTTKDETIPKSQTHINLYSLNHKKSFVINSIDTQNITTLTNVNRRTNVATLFPIPEFSQNINITNFPIQTNSQNLPNNPDSNTLIPNNQPSLITKSNKNQPFPAVLNKDSPIYSTHPTTTTVSPQTSPSKSTLPTENPIALPPNNTDDNNHSPTESLPSSKLLSTKTCSHQLSDNIEPCSHHPDYKNVPPNPEKHETPQNQPISTPNPQTKTCPPTPTTETNNECSHVSKDCKNDIYMGSDQNLNTIKLSSYKNDPSLDKYRKSELIVLVPTETVSKASIASVITNQNILGLKKDTKKNTKLLKKRSFSLPGKDSNSSVSTDQNLNKKLLLHNNMYHLGSQNLDSNETFDFSLNDLLFSNTVLNTIISEGEDDNFTSRTKHKRNRRKSTYVNPYNRLRNMPRDRMYNLKNISVMDSLEIESLGYESNNEILGKNINVGSYSIYNGFTTNNNRKNLPRFDKVRLSKSYNDISFVANQDESSDPFSMSLLPITTRTSSKQFSISSSNRKLSEITSFSIPPFTPYLYPISSPKHEKSPRENSKLLSKINTQISENNISPTLKPRTNNAHNRNYTRNVGDENIKDLNYTPGTAFENALSVERCLFEKNDDPRGISSGIHTAVGNDLYNKNSDDHELISLLFGKVNFGTKNEQFSHSNNESLENDEYTLANKLDMLSSTLSFELSTPRRNNDSFDSSITFLDLSNVDSTNDLISYFPQGSDLLSGALFAVLLNFKHIFIYIAPAYFVYLLKRSLLQPSFFTKLSYLAKLGSVIIFICLLSFGPFIYMNQIPQLMSRLFPFKRGLCHAYWAPNFWALYTLLDRILIKVSNVFGLGLLNVDSGTIVSNTRGLVGNTEFGVLVDIAPSWTFIITIISQLPYLVKIWIDPVPKKLIYGIFGCGISSFMFGWHVHEKAIMLFLVPQCLNMINAGYIDSKVFVFANISGFYGLFPLLFESLEIPTKYTILLVWTLVSVQLMKYQKDTRSVGGAGNNSKKQASVWSTLNTFEKLYSSIGFLALSLYCDVFHSIMFGKNKLEFLPLALTSTYCAVGITYSWILSYFC